MGWQSQIVKRCRWGEPPYCAWSRCSSINDTACSLQQSCCLHWARHCMQCSSEPDCGLLYVVQTSTAFGRVVECGRVNCAFFGRRRPKKAEDAVLWECNQ